MSEKKTEQTDKPVELSDTDVEQAAGGVKNNPSNAKRGTIYEGKTFTE